VPAEIAFAVADRHQGRRIGSTLVALLAADARAAGIKHLTATMQSSNSVAYALVRKVSKVVDIRQQAGEPTIVAALEAT
jgi:ribosomal protein S18 acetylase RimI-like enzyme